MVVVKRVSLEIVTDATSAISSICVNVAKKMESTKNMTSISLMNSSIRMGTLVAIAVEKLKSGEIDSSVQCATTLTSVVGAKTKVCMLSMNLKNMTGVSINMS